ncbi:mediator of RNA polymerase II transcription subunit 1-like [Conger conger]|uniref:mediator of RNA polymerase II transcription subunit 1-like n=1 Tax=Conger conger TaxID=82655 RepID=UPI002A59DFB2|nr:mediator of RNA polymerase II transcription subunit 1-like [Conger conger]
MTLADWQKAQTEDQYISRVIRFLASAMKPSSREVSTEHPEIKLLLRQWHKLELRNGVLYRKRNDRGRTAYQLVLPLPFRERALQGIHEEVGHLGPERALHLARVRFFWPGMAKAIEEKCKTCERCFRRKAVPQKAAPMESITTTPLYKVLSGSAHKRSESENHSKALWENFIVHYSFPSRLLSDQGRDFESRTIKELCAVIGATKVRTTPYHPRGNPVERFNRTLLGMLGTLEDKEKHHWRDYVKPLVHAYNCTRNDTTGYSPYELMFGRQPRLPIDFVLGITPDTGDHLTHSEYVKSLRQCLQESYSLASESAQKSRDKYKSRFDKTVRAVRLFTGDRVLVRNVKGLGSHRSPTETTCYLTSDMFYLEVLLLPGGDVEDVKVAHHGEAPVSWEPLLTLLRSKRFDDFSMKLDCLSSLYNMIGDNETKIKVYTALQHLERDLLKISQLPRPLIDHDLHVDTILNGRIGKVTLQREGNPLSIKYYISPYDLLTDNDDAECKVALVVAGASDSTHRLQMTSLIQKPPIINSEGLPVFLPLDNVTSEVLPACFFLKLQPPLPMLSSFIHKMDQITEMNLCETDLQWLPFPWLLKASLGETSCSDYLENAHFFVVDNQMHGYVLAGDAWGVEGLRGALVHSIPFTHPAHVPPLLELLRHQAAINTLLSSFITPHRPSEGSEPDLHCEVLPESDSSFSVSFPLHESDCLGVLLVNVKDSHQITCRLFMPCSKDLSIDEYIMRVLKRCMCIPLVMRAICRRLAQNGSSGVIASTLAAGYSAHAVAPAAGLYTAVSEAL